MFKYNKLMLLVALVILLAVTPAFSAVIATVGNYNSDGNYDISVDSDHLITMNGGALSKYEVAVTDDTLTAAESGKTLIVEGVWDTSNETQINLPDADVGLTYTILVGGGMTAKAKGADLPNVVVNPQDTDYIYATNSTAASTFAAGNSIYSGGTTGDSITFTCGKDLYWYAEDFIGTWTDGD